MGEGRREMDGVISVDLFVVSCGQEYRALTDFLRDRHEPCGSKVAQTRLELFVSPISSEHRAGEKFLPRKD